MSSHEQQTSSKASCSSDLKTKIVLNRVFSGSLMAFWPTKQRRLEKQSGSSSVGARVQRLRLHCSQRCEDPVGHDPPSSTLAPWYPPALCGSLALQICASNLCPGLREKFHPFTHRLPLHQHVRTAPGTQVSHHAIMSIKTCKVPFCHQIRGRSTNWRFLSSISGVSGTLEKIATLWK